MPRFFLLLLRYRALIQCRFLASGEEYLEISSKMFSRECWEQFGVLGSEVQIDDLNMCFVHLHVLLIVLSLHLTP